VVTPIVDATVTLGCLHKSINEILRHSHFTDGLVAAFDACIGDGLSAVEQEHSRRVHFREMIHRVVRNARDHPRLHTLSALVQDAGVTDEDSFAALEFIYSCLVNHFKGELAEVLARPLLRTWVSHLASTGLIPDEVEVVPGYDLRAPRLAGDPGQHKCADAILRTTADRLARWTHVQDHALPSDGVMIAGVVEIKASRKSPPKVLEQLAGHVNRFDLPWNLRGRGIDPARTFIAQCPPNGRTAWIPATEPIVVDRVPRLFVRPCNRSGPLVAPQSLGPMVWVSELSFTTKEMLEAAFRFAMWLASQAGTDTFDLGGTVDTSQAKGAGGPTAMDSTAQDRLLQALYHLGREGFITQTTPRAQRAAKTFFWLYNVFSYGRERARGDRLQWPDEHPALPRHATTQTEPPISSSVGAASIAHISASHRAYARSRLDEAKQLLKKAKAAGVPSSHASKVSWLEGMIAYREGRFAEALGLFPGPGPDRQDKWWRRDQVMLARLHARAGSVATARELLAALEPVDQWPDRAFPVEYYGVVALVALRENHGSSRRSAIHDGLALLEAVRTENRERRERHLNELWTVHPQTVQMAVFDLAAVLAATGYVTEAIHHLTQLSGFDGWELDYLARDELLACVFGVPDTSAQLAAWLEQERGA